MCGWASRVIHDVHEWVCPSLGCQVDIWSAFDFPWYLLITLHHTWTFVMNRTFFHDNYTIHLFMLRRAVFGEVIHISDWGFHKGVRYANFLLLQFYDIWVNLDTHVSRFDWIDDWSMGLCWDVHSCKGTWVFYVILSGILSLFVDMWVSCAIIGIRDC